MSATIDPVTGLPIVVPLTTGLDTIPLGVQTFPWKDYKATQRPNRQLMYPDDIIPVSANVAGMYQDQSQVVGTDGNHALLVSDVNSGGSSGGSIVPFLDKDHMGEFPWDNSGFSLGTGTGDNRSKLISATFCALALVKDPGENILILEFGITQYLASPTKFLALGKIALYSDDITNPGYFQRSTMIFSQPLDIAASFGEDPPYSHYVGGANGSGIWTMLTVWEK